MTQPIDFNIYHYKEITSTSDFAKDFVKQGAEQGTLVWADVQTHGRGRHGRTWVSTEGNLFFSFILKPEHPQSKLWELSFVSALAVGRTLEQYLGDLAPINYKWPNDILLDEKKISGVLLESEEYQSMPAVVVGVGINTISSPAEAIYPTNCLQRYLTNPPSAHDMLNKFLEYFKDVYDLWLSSGFAPIREEWLIKAFRLSQHIKLSSAGQGREGIFRDLSLDGALILETPEGEIDKIYTADVLG